ncbi:hypothetical protein HPB52_002970 [Rhipicephalus sanguineus]|uniref:PiggyBac transposable element-derived protein domain-containing protein n=1 Tax=Rhipicephalus sanguineus TaxID=34632 RepID=A0A9D4Q9M9_RHISA|nr:hypothetical protein HPB52_002970 [Rhipicephalus sanguineus]
MATGLGWELVLPKQDDNVVVADNFFTGPHLVEALSRMGISYIGTVRENRISCSKLMDEKSMKKRGRGTCDTSVISCDQKTMVAVKWHDNRTVTLLSNCIGADPVTSVKRWDSKEKKHIFVGCPAIIPAYNRSMGGGILQQHKSPPTHLREFLSELATSLSLLNKRPPGRPSVQNVTPLKKVCLNVRRDVRRDSKEHWPT